MTAQFGNFYTLSFTTTGQGTVSADSGALQSCSASGGVCSGSYLVGSQVILTETPDSGAALSGWSGACASASGSHCTLTMSAAMSAGASFSDATTLSAASGDAQSAPIDAALPLPIVIHLVDNTSGANVPGASVSLSGPAGSSVVPASASTDSQGNATFHIRLSRIIGIQTYTATTPTAGSLLISATATEPTPGTIFTVVNTSHSLGLDGFPGPATMAHLRSPTGLAIAADGTLYIADSANQAVFALSPAGILTLIAGTGTAASPATAARRCPLTSAGRGISRSTKRTATARSTSPTRSTAGSAPSISRSPRRRSPPSPAAAARLARALATAMSQARLRWPARSASASAPTAISTSATREEIASAGSSSPRR